jgi:hypothetical protein
MSTAEEPPPRAVITANAFEREVFSIPVGWVSYRGLKRTRVVSAPKPNGHGLETRIEQPFGVGCAPRANTTIAISPIWGQSRLMKIVNLRYIYDEPTNIGWLNAQDPSRFFH